MHEENGTLFITLFARLTREFQKNDGQKRTKKIESIWFDIEEIKMDHATRKMRDLPNCVYRYKVSKDVFLGLFRAAAICPKELYYVTPFPIFQKFEKK